MKTRILFCALLAFVSFLTIFSPALADDPDIIWKKPDWEVVPKCSFTSTNFSVNDSFFVYNCEQFTNLGDTLFAFILNTFTREIVKQYSPIKYARYSDDGKLLVGHLDSTIIVVGVDSMKKIVEFPSTDRLIKGFDINKAGTKVFSIGKPYGSANGTDTIMYDEWDIPTATLTRHIVPDTGVINYSNVYIMTSIIVSDTTDSVILGFRIERPKFHDIDDVLWTINLSDYSIKYKLDNKGYSNIQIFNKKSRIFGFDGSWKTYDVNTGALIRSITGYTLIDYNRITSDGRYWLIPKFFDSLIVVDLNTLDTIYKYNGIEPEQMAFSPSGKYFLTFDGVNVALVNARWSFTSVHPQDTVHEAETIYPNPSNGSININFASKNNELKCIQLFDNKGNLLKVIKNSDIMQSEDSVSFDVSYFPSGQYQIMIERKGGVTIKKLLIIK